MLTIYQNRNSYRHDFHFRNEQNHRIEVSLFIPISKNLDFNIKEINLRLNCPCVIYCHSQSGNKVEGLFLKENCIANNYALCLFDFSGCGKSEGEYVTLGKREMVDLLALVEIIVKKHTPTSIILWGRSMGAVTCLYLAKRYSFYLTAIVILLDSRFSLF